MHILIDGAIFDDFRFSSAEKMIYVRLCANGFADLSKTWNGLARDYGYDRKTTKKALRKLSEYGYIGEDGRVY